MRPELRVSWPFGSRPITACDVTDLPEPDSPTTQTISPGLTSSDRSSTAFARSPPPGRRTVRLLMERTGPLIASHPPRELRIEPVAQAVAEHVDAQDGDGERDARI